MNFSEVLMFELGSLAEYMLLSSFYSNNVYFGIPNLRRRLSFKMLRDRTSDMVVNLSYY